MSDIEEKQIPVLREFKSIYNKIKDYSWVEFVNWVPEKAELIINSNKEELSVERGMRLDTKTIDQVRSTTHSLVIVTIKLSIG